MRGMDHKAFLAALPADVKTDLTVTGNGPGLRRLAAHGGLIVLAGALIAAGVPGWWLLLPVQGVLIAFLFAAEHECTHRTPFASARLNDWVGRMAGVMLVLPFEWFRYFHLAHHRWTNIPGRDPELAAPKPATRAAWLWMVTGLPYWTAQARLVWRLATGSRRGHAAADYLPPGAMPRVRAEARGMLAVYALAALSLLWSPLVIWIWVVPVLIGQPVLRAYLLAEHGDCPEVADMFQNTRTTFTTRLMRFLAWNMPYHVEHHVYPSVPFHRLPDLHRLMRQELRVTAHGYAAFTREYLARRG